MKENYAKSLAAVLVHEGGYVNHPKDPGGETNKGVTKAVYDAFRETRGLPLRSVRYITDSEVGIIYSNQYWNKVKADDLPSGIDYCVFDFAVNSGPSRAIKYLQMALGVSADGVIGPVTIAAAKQAEPRYLINTICDKRLTFLKSLSTWGTFGRGWSSRVAGVRKMALEMVSAPKPEPVPPIDLPDDLTPVEPPKVPPPLDMTKGVAAVVLAAIMALIAAAAAWIGFGGN